MSNYTNREILSAVITTWAEPLLGMLANSKLSQVPFLANIESKVRSTGWVSGQWNIGAELAPFMSGLANTLVQPLLNQYLSSIPDNAVPNLAHSIVDTALENGELSLLEGNITFDKDDLTKLKKLLNANLPCTEVKTIKIKEDEK